MSQLQRFAAGLQGLNLTYPPGRARNDLIPPLNLDTFRRIRDYSASGFSLNRIAELLAVVESPADQSTELMRLSDFVQSLEIAHAAVTRLQNQIDENSIQMEEQQARIQALEEYVTLPWYKKITGKPPKKESF